MAAFKRNHRFRISFNAPAVLTFAIACVLVQLLSMLTGGGSNRLLFSVYRSSLLDPLTYLRLFGHVLGHGSWEHLLNNMMFILILGPMIEEKYGTSNVIAVMVITAFVTGVISMIFLPGTALLGASGIVFSFILLSSITSFEEGTIPLTFILVAVLYIGREIWNGVTAKDNISQLAHIAGGLVGSGLGFLMNRWHMTQKR
ncbi:MAG: rhomboid family intramembrane serine protease [Clostridia bacterium]|nr:rhomboid family intramembrane serine protease [Clostridia bacterium]